MIQNIKSLFRRAYEDQRGQMIPILAFMMITLLGFAGLVVDVGHAYFSYRLLQNSTNAAALAGAQGLPFNTTSTNQALVNAKAYSSQAASKSQSAGYNAYGNLNITNAVYKLGCVTAAVGAGIPCVSTGVGSNTANAIQVTQTATMSTTFMRLFGFSTITMSATGTALMRGSANAPYNVAIIVDTTNSMTSNTDSNCNASRLQCALNGVKTFLQDLSPCAAASCGGSTTNQNYPNSLDRVALFSFPNFTTTTASKQYDCSSSTSPTAEVYTFPPIGASSMTTMPYGTGTNPPQMTYEVTYHQPSSNVTLGDANGFVSDYRTSNSATTLYTSSNVVLAAGGKSGCTGINGPGGEGTYYAGVIYAAQAALTAEANLHKGSQNVMILVSDGAATATSSQMANSTQSSTYATSNGTYPSYKKECQQAVTAAQYATSQGTTVYAVAYGAQSSGCTTDTGSYASPCYTMSKIASSAATFYSDDNVSGIYSNCPAGKSVSSLNTIFNQIAGNLTIARLIPNSAFPSS